MNTLTPRQQQVLACIVAHLQRQGYPPTLREIAHELGIRGTLAVSKHLAALQRKGYLERNPGNSRALSVAGRPPAAPQLPILGRVRAGTPQPALEEIEGYCSVDPAYRHGATFLLRVMGDSMIAAGIHEGDLALVRPQPEAENGAIVVALVDGEATLKRFFREGDQIRLQPENPTLAPIVVRPGATEVLLVGKVVGLFRSLE